MADTTTDTRIALIPAYCPDDALIALCGRLRGDGFAIVVVDDGSGADYEKIFEAVSADAVVLTHPINRGKGQALRTGLEYIQKRFDSGVVVTLDADGQHTAEDTLRVCEEAERHPGALVLGSRDFGRDTPRRSRFGNGLTRFVYRMVTGLAVRDTQTGLRAFTIGLIPFLLTVGGDRYEYEMNMLLLGSREEIPIREVTIQTLYFNNNAGSHFNTVRDSLRVYGQILRFAASSLVCFLLDYGLYSLLTVLTASLGSGSIPLSNVCARIVSAAANYLINKRLVFQRKGHLLRTAAGYFTLAALILAGNTLTVTGLTQGLGLNPYLAKLLTELVFFTLSWLGQRFIVFRKGKSDKAPAASEPK